ncbi:MAG TPA: hypothetical protein VEA41_15255 [Salinarimonas sp.]|jgi:hypothetical protein|nr:hypothetical protein [Salinarimonas sp.]
MLRSLVPALAGLALSASAAIAGGQPCVDCYRHVVHPPVYGVQHERVMVRAPRTHTEVVPAEYRTVAETVMVSPARKVWQVSYDAYGQKVGCWVTVPAQYATRHRHVMVRPEQVIPVAIPAVYGHVSRKVLVEPARAGWEPIGHRGYGY